MTAAKAIRLKPKTFNELCQQMLAQKYDEVDRVLSRTPSLLTYRNRLGETPLFVAIKLWDSKIVGLCMKHGANPHDKIDESDPLSLNAILFATKIFHERIAKDQNSSTLFEREFKIYEKILQEMVCCAPFPQGC